MKFFLNFVIIFFFLINNSYSEQKIAYINIDKFLNQSLVGISLNKQFDKILSEKKNTFEKEKKNLIDIETDLKNKKNVISSDEYNNLLKNFKEKMNKYNNSTIKFENNFKLLKSKYTNQVLEELKPLLNDYVKNNNISLLISQKLVIVGKKNLDITNDIIQLVNKKLDYIEVNF